MKAVPEEIAAYHNAGLPLTCEIDVQPWFCEFWPLDKLLAYNLDYEVETYAPELFCFATSGGGEMYALTSSGAIVCIPFVGMAPQESLQIAESWLQFIAMLHPVPRK